MVVVVVVIVVVIVSVLFCFVLGGAIQDRVILFNYGCLPEQGRRALNKSMHS